MKKPAIDPVPMPGNPRSKFDAQVKETLEILTGRRGGKLEPLASTASTAEIIAKLNEIIDRLQ